ncbi:hypothetical protein E4U43_006793 [Claviceps pusilla]|uniref:Uncharacterized protein n=1 Tax=Claviceps pusilla TaxID=123648 RepID=A0A9P7SVK3_9HYPO|nr:hypothetical protein E4U43_006793 [Claviceps pusilla]
MGEGQFKRHQKLSGLPSIYQVCQVRHAGSHTQIFMHVHLDSAPAPPRLYPKSIDPWCHKSCTCRWLAVAAKWFTAGKWSSLVGPTRYFLWLTTSSGLLGRFWGTSRDLSAQPASRDCPGISLYLDGSHGVGVFGQESGSHTNHQTASIKVVSRLQLQFSKGREAKKSATENFKKENIAMK